MSFNRGVAIQLRPARLNIPSLAFDFLHSYQIVDDQERNKIVYRATTISYQYRVLDNRGNELICFHWDRLAAEGERRFPHVHVHGNMTLAGYGDETITKPSHRLHIPTSRVSLESVVRLLIEDFEIEPIVRDWDNRLTEHERQFFNGRTNHGFAG